MRVVALQQHDRLPLIGHEEPADAIGFRFYIGVELQIALDLHAAGSTYLHEREFPLIIGVLLEKAFDSAEAFENSFGVIHAVHAHTHELRLYADPGQQRGAIDVGRFAGRRIASVGEVDADRKRPHSREVAAAIHRQAFPLDAALHSVIHRFKEIVAMILNVKTHQVCAEQSIHEFALPRTDSESLCVRPGDVPKDGHARVGPFSFDHARQQGEVIVLREDEWLLRIRDLLEHRIREFAIDLLVMFPILRAKDRPRVRDMAKGPESLVRKAEVIAVFLLSAEPHAPKRISRLGRRHAQTIAFVHRFAIGIAAGFGDPGTVAGTQNRLERSHQATGGNHDFQIAVLPRVNIRLAIRDHHEAPLLQLLANMHCKTIGRPQRLACLPQMRFAFRRGPCLLQGLHHAFHLFCQRPQ